MISGYHIGPHSPRGTIPALSCTSWSELPIQHQLLGKHQSPKHENTKPWQRTDRRHWNTCPSPHTQCQGRPPWGTHQGNQPLPSILGHLKDKAKITSWVIQAIVKNPVIKVHLKTTNQSPNAAYCPCNFSLCYAWRWLDLLYFLIFLPPISLFILYLCFITHFFTSQAYLYPEPKELHN